MKHTRYQVESMRPAAKKFHFLKVETIVVDRRALHKTHFLL